LENVVTDCILNLAHVTITLVRWYNHDNARVGIIIIIEVLKKIVNMTFVQRF
jgi:hypothetical protein